MNPRSMMSPWRWVMFGITTVILTVIAVEAFGHGAVVIGWIVAGVLLLYLAARVFLAVALARAKSRAAITPPVPLSAEQRERRIRVMVVTYSGTFAVVAILAFVAGLFVPHKFSVFCWVLTGTFVLFGGLMLVAWRVGLRRRTATQESQS
jgi:hypothetical protein